MHVHSSVIKKTVAITGKLRKCHKFAHDNYASKGNDLRDLQTNLTRSELISGQFQGVVRIKDIFFSPFLVLYTRLVTLREIILMRESFVS